MHPSLQENCYHQITFIKVNKKIFYPPPYKHLVWDYRNVNVEAVKENAFDSKDIHAQIALFNETLLNIFSNFITKRTKTFIDSDPPWMTENIKNKVKA